MNDKLQLLNYLKTIISTGSITSAAQKLYISQPYLSRYVHHAEIELGLPILNRDTRPISLTIAGAKYLQGLEDILSGYDALVSEVNRYAHPDKPITVGINQSLASRSLPMMLSNFYDSNPDEKVFVEESPSHDLENALLDRKIDLHVRMLPIFPSNITYDSLFEMPIYLIVNKSCPFFLPYCTEILPLNISNTEWINSDFIFLHSGSGFMRLIDSFLAVQKLKINKSFQVRYIETAANLAYQGLGCTFIPKSYLQDNFDAGLCNVFQLPPEILTIKVVLSYLTDGPLNPIAANFINATKQLYA